MASAVDSRLAYARLSAVATASRLPTATRGSNNSYTTSWDTTAAPIWDVCRWPSIGRLLEQPPRFLGFRHPAGYEEEARLYAQATLLPGSESGGFGQNDVASPVFLAWTKQDRAGRPRGPVAPVGQQAPPTRLRSA